MFIELLRHPVARALVEATIGPEWLVSNFTANVALPGSGSMNVHSDQALVVPPPWKEPWAINVIWCFDDVHEANGATRHIPGSQHWRASRMCPTICSPARCRSARPRLDRGNGGARLAHLGRERDQG